jgi:hypothetical protein
VAVRVWCPSRGTAKHTISSNTKHISSVNLLVDIRLCLLTFMVGEKCKHSISCELQTKQESDRFDGLKTATRCETHTTPAARIVSLREAVVRFSWLNKVRFS